MRAGLVSPVSASIAVIEPAENRPRQACRVGEGLVEQRQQLRWPRGEPVDGAMNGAHRSDAAPEEAHHEQVVQRLEEWLVVGVARVREGFDRTDKEAMCDVDITVAVERVVGTGDRAGQRPATFRIGLPRLRRAALPRDRDHR